MMIVYDVMVIVCVRMNVYALDRALAVNHAVL